MAELVQRFFHAMQAGPDGADALLALFADDAVYVEPFSGEERTHEGLDAIREALRPGWEQPLPDLTITVDRVDTEGDRVTAEWTCRSPALPGGEGRGTNVFHVDGGQIRRLHTMLRGRP